MGQRESGGGGTRGAATWRGRRIRSAGYWRWGREGDTGTQLGKQHPSYGYTVSVHPSFSSKKGIYGQKVIKTMNTIVL